MPIRVVCPSCDAPLSAPDAAAGRTVKCPKCHERMILPAAEADDGFDVVDEPDDGFEVVDTAPPPRKRKIVVEDDEDDLPPRKKRAADDYDDEGDDRPRPKRKKRPTPARMPVWIWAVAGVVAVLLTGVGVFLAVRGKGETGKGATGGGGAAVRKLEWVRLDAPDGLFTAHFPETAARAADMASLAPPGANPQQIEQAERSMQQFGIKANVWVNEYAGRKYMLVVMSFPPLMAGQMKLEALDNPQATAQFQQLGGASGAVADQKDATLGGVRAKQLLARQPAGGRVSLTRLTITGGKMVFLVVEAGADLTLEDDIANQFFDKFELKAKAG